MPITSGLFGKEALLARANTKVWYNASTAAATCNIVFCNRSDKDTAVRIAIIPSSVLTVADSDYIVYDQPLPVGTVFEMTGIVVGTQETIYCYASDNGVTVRIHGFVDDRGPSFTDIGPATHNVAGLTTYATGLDIMSTNKAATPALVKALIDAFATGGTGGNFIIDENGNLVQVGGSGSGVGGMDTDALTTALNYTNTEISRIEGQTSALDRRTSAVETAVVGINKRLDTLNVTDISSSILADAKTYTDSSITNTVTSINSKIETTDGKIATLRSDVSTLRSDVNALKTGVGSEPTSGVTKEYVDAEIADTKTYVDAEIADTKTYAEDKDAIILSDAKNYTDLNTGDVTLMINNTNQEVTSIKTNVQTINDNLSTASNEINNIKTTIENIQNNGVLPDLVPIENGGTGKTTASEALNALGGIPITGGTFTGSIGINTTNPIINFQTNNSNSGSISADNSQIRIEAVKDTTENKPFINVGFSDNEPCTTVNTPSANPADNEIVNINWARNNCFTDDNYSNTFPLIQKTPIDTTNLQDSLFNEKKIISNDGVALVRSDLESKTNGLVYNTGILCNNTIINILRATALDNLVNLEVPTSNFGSYDRSVVNTFVSKNLHQVKINSDKAIFYVGGANASDQDGLFVYRGFSSDKPFSTFEGCLDFVAKSYTCIERVTIIVQEDFTVTAPEYVLPKHNCGVIFITSNNSSTLTFNTLCSHRGRYIFENISLVINNYICVQYTEGLEFTNTNISCSSNNHLFVVSYNGLLKFNDNNNINVNGLLSILNACQFGNICLKNGNFVINGSVSTATFIANNCGRIIIEGSVSGNVTGKRYSVTNGSCIITKTKSETEIPGNATGLKDSTSIYA